MATDDSRGACAGLRACLARARPARDARTAASDPSAAPVSDGSFWERTRSRILVLVLLLLALLLALVFGQSALAGEERARLRDAFLQSAESRAALFADAFAGHLRGLRNLARAYEGDPAPLRPNDPLMLTLGTSILQFARSAFSGVSTAAEVKGEERAAMETAIRDAYGVVGRNISFSFFRTNADGSVSFAPNSPARDLYAVVLTQANSTGISQAIGLDIYSEPLRRTAALESRATNVIAATDPINIFSANGTIQQRGMNVYASVFGTTNPRSVAPYGRPVNETTHPFKGYIVATIVVDNIVTQVSRLRERNSQLYFFAEDVTHANNSFFQALRATETSTTTLASNTIVEHSEPSFVGQDLFFLRDDGEGDDEHTDMISRRRAMELVADEPNRHVPLLTRFAVRFGNRVWSFTILGTDHFVDVHYSQLHTAILIGGLIALFFIFLMGLALIAFLDRNLMEERRLQRASVDRIHAARKAHEKTVNYACHELRNPLHIISGTVELLLGNLRAALADIDDSIFFDTPMLSDGTASAGGGRGGGRGGGGNRSRVEVSDSMPNLGEPSQWSKSHLPTAARELVVGSTASNLSSRGSNGGGLGGAAHPSLHSRGPGSAIDASQSALLPSTSSLPSAEGSLSETDVREVVRSVIEKAEADVSVIRHSTTMMHRLVNDLLDLARLNAGRLSVSPRPVFPRALVLDLAKSHSRFAKVNIVWRVEQEVPPLVVVDPLRLSQLLANGLTNACKYSHPNAKIAVVAALEYRRPLRWKADEDLEKYSDPLYQGPATNTARVRRTHSTSDSQLSIEDAESPLAGDELTRRRDLESISPNLLRFCARDHAARLRRERHRGARTARNSAVETSAAGPLSSPPNSRVNGSPSNARLSSGFEPGTARADAPSPDLGVDRAWVDDRWDPELDNAHLTTRFRVGEDGLLRSRRGPLLLGGADIGPVASETDGVTVPFLVIRIHNRGQGLRGFKQAQLFQPFVQTKDDPNAARRNPRPEGATPTTTSAATVPTTAHPPAPPPAGVAWSGCRACHRQSRSSSRPGGAAEQLQDVFASRRDFVVRTRPIDFNDPFADEVQFLGSFPGAARDLFSPEKRAAIEADHNAFVARQPYARYCYNTNLIASDQPVDSEERPMARTEAVATEAVASSQVALTVTVDDTPFEERVDGATPMTAARDEGGVRTRTSTSAGFLRGRRRDSGGGDQASSSGGIGSRSSSDVEGSDLPMPPLPFAPIMSVRRPLATVVSGAGPEAFPLTSPTTSHSVAAAGDRIHRGSSISAPTPASSSGALRTLAALDPVLVEGSSTRESVGLVAGASAGADSETRGAGGSFEAVAPAPGPVLAMLEGATEGVGAKEDATGPQIEYTSLTGLLSSLAAGATRGLLISNTDQALVPPATGADAGAGASTSTPAHPAEERHRAVEEGAHRSLSTVARHSHAHARAHTPASGPGHTEASPSSAHRGGARPRTGSADDVDAPAFASASAGASAGTSAGLAARPRSASRSHAHRSGHGARSRPHSRSRSRAARRTDPGRTPGQSPSDASQRAIEGTGLGLSFSRSLARSLGGDLILWESSADLTVFEVCVPLRPPTELLRAMPATAVETLHHDLVEQLQAIRDLELADAAAAAEAAVWTTSMADSEAARVPAAAGAAAAVSVAAAAAAAAGATAAATSAPMTPELSGIHPLGAVGAARAPSLSIGGSSDSRDRGTSAAGWSMPVLYDSSGSPMATVWRPGDSAAGGSLMRGYLPIEGRGDVRGRSELPVRGWLEGGVPSGHNSTGSIVSAPSSPFGDEGAEEDRGSGAFRGSTRRIAREGGSEAAPGWEGAGAPRRSLQRGGSSGSAVTHEVDLTDAASHPPPSTNTVPSRRSSAGDGSVSGPGSSSSSSSGGGGGGGGGGRAGILRNSSSQSRGGSASLSGALSGRRDGTGPLAGVSSGGSEMGPFRSVTASDMGLIAEEGQNAPGSSVSGSASTVPTRATMESVLSEEAVAVRVTASGTIEDVGSGSIPGPSPRSPEHLRPDGHTGGGGGGGAAAGGGGGGGAAAAATAAAEEGDAGADAGSEHEGVGWARGDAARTAAVRRGSAPSAPSGVPHKRPVRSRRTGGGGGGLGLHVLLADDEKSARDLLVRFLQAMGCTSVAVADGTELEEELVAAGNLPPAPGSAPVPAEARTQRFDVVFTDIMMANSDGALVTNHLVHERGLAIPVIAMSGNSSAQDLAEFRRCGFWGILPKPFGNEELVAKLRAAAKSLREGGPRDRDLWP